MRVAMEATALSGGIGDRTRIAVFTGADTV